MISVAEKIAAMSARHRMPTKLGMKYVVLIDGTEKFFPASWSWQTGHGFMRLMDGTEWKMSIFTAHIRELWASYKDKLEADLAATL